MITDLQLAPYLKRLSAFLLDIIVILIISTGGALLMSYIVNFDTRVDEYNSYVTYYEETYDVKFGLSEEEFNTTVENLKASGLSAIHTFP